MDLNQPIQVQSDKPSEDTEWNDILRQHGIIPEKPKVDHEAIEEALIQAREIVHEKRLDHLAPDELSDLEDLEDEDFLESYRQKRIAEMQAVAKKAKFGHVFPISKNEWSREITECSEGVTEEEKEKGGQIVLVHLSHESVPESVHLSRVWKEAAERWPEVKFCEILGSRAVEGWPKERSPTIIIYKAGDVIDTIVGWRREWGVWEVDELLVKHKAASEEDLRIVKGRRAKAEGRDKPDVDEGDEDFSD